MNRVNGLKAGANDYLAKPFFLRTGAAAGESAQARRQRPNRIMLNAATSKWTC